MNTLQNKDKFVAGVAFDIAGMGYKNPKTGEIEGFEADLARSVVEELTGARDNIDFVQVTDDHRIPELQQNLVDMVLSQLTITPDRSELVDFSVPYYFAREAILVPKGSNIKSFADLKEKRVAVTAGSVSLRRMRASIPEDMLIITPLSFGGLEAVAKGEADAASNDNINLTMLRKYSGNPEQFDIIDIGDRFDEKPFAIAVKKGNSTLLNRLNAAIKKLKENGEIDKILNTYL